jgi:hypothetical protein
MFYNVFALGLVGRALGGDHVRNALLGELSAVGSGHHSGLPFSLVFMGDEKRHRRAVLAAEARMNGSYKIKWSHVDHATPRDVIALTCDDRPSWPLHEAFDAVAATGAPSGAVEIPALPDLRCRYVARYIVARDTSVGEIAAELQLPIESLPLYPKQIHLSFTPGARDEMLVIWTSAHADPAPTVRWGTDPHNLTHSVTGTSSTYAAADMCNAPANESGPLKFVDPGHIHRVVLTGLPLGANRSRAKLFYSVGQGADLAGFSPVSSFRARSAPDADAVKFIMYADQSLPFDVLGPAWHLPAEVVEDLEAGFDGFLLHPGDLGYAMGGGLQWDLYMELIAPIASRVAYQVSVGNHEFDYDWNATGGSDPSGDQPGGWHPGRSNNRSWGNFGDDSRGECGVPTSARFNGTGTAAARLSAGRGSDAGSAAVADDGSNGIYWYSFDEGGVHVVMMSSEHDWRNGSVQQAWVERDLAAVNRTATPWIVLATHRMMYTTQLLEAGDYAVSLALRAHCEHLLRRYKVNLMLVGHQHSYERSCEVWNGTCVDAARGERGTTHIVAGSAGASLEKGGFSPALGNWSVKHINAWGYTRIDADRSRMKVEWIKVAQPLVGEPKEVWDSFEILPWV